MQRRGANAGRIARQDREAGSSSLRLKEVGSKAVAASKKRMHSSCYRRFRLSAVEAFLVLCGSQDQELVLISAPR